MGCSATTTASVNVAGNWDTAAAVNLIGGQNMTFFAGNLLKGNGGYTVWNAAGSQSYGTQLDGGGGTLPGGGSYTALVVNNTLGSTYQVDQFPGADFGAKLQACLGTLSASYGGTCDARNFTGTQSMGSNLTISTANATVLLPCATISTANQVIVTAGTQECDAARLRTAGSQHSQRKPGRDGLSVFGNGRDGAGGRSDLCRGYDGISLGQRGDQYDGSEQRNRAGTCGLSHAGVGSGRACISWVTRTRRV